MREQSTGARVVVGVGFAAACVTILVFFTGIGSIRGYLDLARTALDSGRNLRLGSNDTTATTEPNIDSAETATADATGEGAASDAQTSGLAAAQDELLVQPRNYPVSVEEFSAIATVDGASVTVPAGWKASMGVQSGVCEFVLSGSSNVAMSVLSPASFDFDAERAAVQAAGYYKEVFYEREQYSGGRTCMHWQYHARSRDLSQLRHVDVWHFPGTASSPSVVVKSEFPTYNGRDDAGEVLETTVVVASLRWP